MVRIRINIGIAPLENKNTKGLKGQGRRGKSNVYSEDKETDRYHDL